MRLKIKNSDAMEKFDALIREKYTYTPKIIRIPKDYREHLGTKIDDFIHLRNNEGFLETFQVCEALREDIEHNTMCAYLSESQYKKMPIENGGNELQLVTNITLGCDPEAFLVNKFNGRLISVDRWLKKFGDVGNDGQLLEFRPAPSTEAEIVCNNLWGLIKKARLLLNSMSVGNESVILSGSSYQRATAGFHLHYGFPRDLLGSSSVYSIIRLLTPVFDYYVGVPSIIPEGNTDIFRRSTNGLRYGKPGEFRVDRRTFEFRLPGGVNMSHPILAKGLLSLGAIVAEDIISRINTFTESFILVGMVNEVDIRDLYPNLPNTTTIYSIVCNPDISLAKKNLDLIQKDIRNMVGYHKRKKAVDEYFDCIYKDKTFGNIIENNWGEYYDAK